MAACIFKPPGPPTNVPPQHKAGWLGGSAATGTPSSPCSARQPLPPVNACTLACTSLHSSVRVCTAHKRAGAAGTHCKGSRNKGRPCSQALSFWEPCALSGCSLRTKYQAAVPSGTLLTASQKAHQHRPAHACCLAQPAVPVCLDDTVAHKPLWKLHEEQQGTLSTEADMVTRGSSCPFCLRPSCRHTTHSLTQSLRGCERLTLAYKRCVSRRIAPSSKKGGKDRGVVQKNGKGCRLGGE